MGSLFIKPKKLREPRLRVTLPPDWHEIGYTNKHRPTYARKPGAGVLEVSMTKPWLAAARTAVVTVTELSELVAERVHNPPEVTVQHVEGGEIGGEPWTRMWATAVCHSPGSEHYQAWYVSDGTDFIFATYISPRIPEHQELVEVTAIVFRLSLIG